MQVKFNSTCVWKKNSSHLLSDKGLLLHTHGHTHRCACTKTSQTHISKKTQVTMCCDQLKLKCQNIFPMSIFSRTPASSRIDCCTANPWGYYEKKVTCKIYISLLHEEVECKNSSNDSNNKDIYKESTLVTPLQGSHINELMHTFVCIPTHTKTRENDKISETFWTKKMFLVNIEWQFIPDE